MLEMPGLILVTGNSNSVHALLHAESIVPIP
jgi:hypothetical protein